MNTHKDTICIVKTVDILWVITLSLYTCTHGTISTIVPALQSTKGSFTNKNLSFVGFVKALSPYVIGSEKWDHFPLNTFFGHFLNCHHSKASRARFPLGLQGVWAFNFIDPTLKATASLLS